MQNFRVYLAGAMSNISHSESLEWRIASQEWFKKIDSDYNLKIINPVDYYNFTGKTPYDSELEVMEYDLWQVRSSDVILVNLNHPSTGTAMELMCAYERKIPVIGFNETNRQLHPWEQCCCNKIFNNQLEALQYIKNYYLD